jgi:hypothetical protein
MNRLLVSAASFAMAFAAFAPAVAQAQELRPIMVQNNCYKSIRLWIRHADGWRNWHNHGHFVFAGNERALYLTDNGVRLSQRTDHSLYFYAEAINGTGTWHGTIPVNVNGYILQMREANYSLQYGAYQILLTC